MQPIPSIPDIQALHRKYAPNDHVFTLVYDHCRAVAEIALWCADNASSTEHIDRELLQAACLLHDIGTYVLFDEKGKVPNRRMYTQHALIGAKLLADEGLDLRIANCVETHLLLGITKEEIAKKRFPLPARDYLPQTIEARLLCYADRFHSKLPTFNSFEVFLGHLQDLPQQAAKFEAWAQEFGVPDVEALAKKYDHPVDAGKPIFVKK